VGRRVREYYDRKAPWLEIVGVAGNVHDDGADRPAPETVYWPAQPDERLLSMFGYQSRRVTIAIRTDRANTQDLRSEVREAVWFAATPVVLVGAAVLASWRAICQLAAQWRLILSRR